MAADWYLVGRVALAAALGYVVGWERAVRGHPAGERTFALLALGAALFTAGVIDTGNTDALSRTVQGIATGVGFIGAAVTWRQSGGDRTGSKGLTTAAAVWAVVAMGALVGSGRLLLGSAAALFVLLLLELRHLPLVRRLDPRRFRERYLDDEAGG